MGENNSYLLLEGKRDNQLLPYLEAFNEKTGNNLSLGNFKSMMLRKLSFEGGIHNISLQSNYYLVGAVRYYFEGLLTNNKDLSIFTDPQTADDWNRDVIIKLNAVILILRNGYIDNFGSEWIEPEDFGTLSLKQLFSKYSKEIKKLIDPNGSKNKAGKVVKDYEMITPKGYTYDIIYSFEDSKKYSDFTSPGAWCITYGNNHLSYYTKYGDGHFVIFRKEGYENVPRVKEKNMWIGDKPQDTYGNSLIAYLQDNNSPGPANYHGAPLITSRWNHGANGIYCEADRAYTQAEFQRITGVSDEDLKGIYETWRRNRGKHKSSGSNKIPKLSDDLLRELKYLQMRINGGENPGSLVSGYDNTKIWSICTAKLSDESTIEFLMVNKKIIFDTVIPGENITHLYNIGIISAFILKHSERYVLVNNRLKNIIQIDDKRVFRAISRLDYYFGNYDEEGITINTNNVYVEAKTGNFEIVLIEPSNGLPLKLPNGQVWFNFICGYRNFSARGGAIAAEYVPKDKIYEITYDLSSQEKYFFDSRIGKFLDVGQNEPNKGSFSLYTALNLPLNFIPIVRNAEKMGESERGRSEWSFPIIPTDVCILFKDGKKYSIVFEVDGVRYKIGNNGPSDCISIPFDRMRVITENWGEDSPKTNELLVIINPGSQTKNSIVLNIQTKRVLQRHDGGTYWINSPNYWTPRSIGNVLILPVMGKKEHSICSTMLRDFGYSYNPASACRYFYDSLNNKYIKNPYNFPSEYMFVDYGLTEDTHDECFTIGKLPQWRYTQTPDEIANFKKQKAEVTRVYCVKDNSFHFIKFKGNSDSGAGAMLLGPVDTELRQPNINNNVQINENDIVGMVKRVINEIMSKK